jgi:hypothetical protein
MIEVSSDILFYIIIGVGALALALGVWIAILSSKLAKFMKGKNGTSLENTIVDLIKASSVLHKEQEYAKAHRKELEHKLSQSIGGVGLVRFNPFKDSGGNQSFACALLDEKGNGVVISTLFSRERMSVFAKPITEFASEHNLSTEETQAIEKTQRSFN